MNMKQYQLSDDRIVIVHKSQGTRTVVSTAFRMETYIAARFCLSISTILAAILDSEKATRVQAATRGKFQAYTKNYWKMQRNDS